MMPDEDHRTHIADADPEVSPSPQTDGGPALRLHLFLPSVGSTIPKTAGP